MRYARPKTQYAGAIMGGAARAQLMTLTMLILFVLMLSILLVFAEITINYNNVAQSDAISSTSTNYALLLQPSISALARASAGRALTVIAQYEMQPSLRSGNFITNLNASLADMISNAMLPGVAAGSAGAAYLSNAMANLTLAAYDTAMLGTINSSYRVVSISQTAPNVTQSNPYSLSVSFIDKVRINTTDGTYGYAIPINVSVPLDGTPDLFYAQRSVVQYVNFTQPQQAAPLAPGQGHGLALGALYASSGNTVASAYGTFFVVPSTPTCSGGSNPLSLYLSAQLMAAPLNKSIILVTPDAAFITNSVCNIANNFGGLITDTITNPPTVPWLEYSSAAALSAFQTGDQALLYGPSLTVLNETGLQSAFYNRYYMTSPFAPSYASRTDGVLTGASPDGSFSLLGAGLQSEYLNGKNSLISVSASNSLYVLPQDTGMTVSAWLYLEQPQSSDGNILSTSGGCGYLLAFASSSTVSFSDGCGDGYAGNYVFSTGRWYDVVATVASGSTPTETYYVNGTQVSQAASSTWTSGSSWSGLDIGSTSFNGELADVQLYDTVLSANQVRALYSDGIETIPQSQSIVGWWPLNGNADDYSGKGNTGTTSHVAFGLAQNYTFDSVFSTPVTASTALAVPGLLSCASSSQCNGAALERVFLGDAYLGVSGPMPTAQFNGQSSYASIPDSSSIDPPNGLAVLAWVYPTSYPSSANVIGSVVSKWGQSDTKDEYLLSISDTGQVEVALGNGLDESGHATTNTIPLDTWTQIGLVYTGSIEYAVIDGQLYDLYSVSGSSKPTNPVSLGIGGELGTGTPYRFFSGGIADVQVYNTSLSAKQVAALYAEGIAGAPILTANAVGWWPLNTNATDLSGHGNGATTVNVSYQYPQPGSGVASAPPALASAFMRSESNFFGFT